VATPPGRAALGDAISLSLAGNAPVTIESGDEWLLVVLLVPPVIGRQLSIVLLLVASCGPAPVRVCDPDSNNCREAGWTGLRPYDRPDRLKPLTTFDRIDVTTRPEGGAGWRFTITNNTEEPVTLALDVSSFAARDGSNTRLTMPHGAPVLIAPHTTWTGVVFGERLLSAETFEDKARRNEANLAEVHNLDAQRRDGAQLQDLVDRERAEVQRLLDGGTVTLVLQQASGGVAWIATSVR
jgi:hypothetical protein